MSDKEVRLFSVMDKDGEIVRLVEANTAGQVKAYLIRHYSFGKPSGYTVAKLVAGGMKVEKA